MTKGRYHCIEVVGGTLPLKELLHMFVVYDSRLQVLGNGALKLLRWI